MLRVGLTGGIATGKSRVLARLAGAGCHAIDLDRIGHETIAPGGAAYDDVRAAFGHAILAPDGSIDRARLGALVFSDPVALQRLNSLVHPRIRAAELRATADLRRTSGGTIIVVDGALLIEAGFHLRYDRLVVTHCPPELQRQRLAARDSLPPDQAEARIRAQMPGEEKCRFAHTVIDTSGARADTDHQVDILARQLREVERTASPCRPLPRAQAGGLLLHAPQKGPRGITPLALLERLSHHPDLELQDLAREMAPSATGPWYRAAETHAPGAPPARLAPILALWSLARRGHDLDFLAAAAASLARLTHTEPAAIAEAIVFACLFHAALLVSSATPSQVLVAGLEQAQILAKRWAGVPPGPAAQHTLEAVLATAARPRAAARSQREPIERKQEDGLELTACLAGALFGVPPENLPARLAGLLTAVARSAASPA